MFKPAAALGMLGLCAVTATAANPISMTQELPLVKGWNAVCLEVSPLDAALETVFQGVPVDRVAAFLRPVSPVEFVTDPDEQPWKRDEWRVWYAPGTAEAPLSDLHAIHANQPYLIRAERAAVLKVTGTVEPIQTHWVSDSYNLVSLPVDLVSPPTFAEFFASSPAHSTLRAYRLEGGRWQLIRSPQSALTRRGEAVWVYCQGASAYQGPLTISTPSRTALWMSSAKAEGSLVVNNLGRDPAEVTISGFGAHFPIALRYEVAALDGFAAFDVPAGEQFALPPLESGSGLKLRLRLRTGTVPASGTIVEIRSDTGILHRLPAFKPSGTFKASP